jgi:SSS family solute:Na+ symporter
VLGGASTVGTVRLGYVHGISGFWLCAALGCGIVALNLFLAKPLLKLKIFTVTQVLEKRYNPMARQASAAIMLAYALMIGVTSILAIGTVLQVLFGLPFWISVLLGGGVVVVYSTIGGMWSLTLTDIVQFVIKTVGLMFILLPICLYRVGGWDELVPSCRQRFSFTTIGWDTIITYFMIYFFGILIGQDIWQRVFTVKTAKVAQYAGTRRYLLHPLRPGLRADRHGGPCADPGSGQRQQRLRRHRQTVAAGRHPWPGDCCGTGGDDVHRQRRPAGRGHHPDRRPAAETARRQAVEPGINRLFTLLTGLVVLGIALVVNDVISALTLAYNLLVGGMLIPLIGAIFWKRDHRRRHRQHGPGLSPPRCCSCSRMVWMPTRRSTTAWR